MNSRFQTEVKGGVEIKTDVCVCVFVGVSTERASKQ